MKFSTSLILLTAAFTSYLTVAVSVSCSSEEPCYPISSSPSYCMLERRGPSIAELRDRKRLALKEEMEHDNPTMTLSEIQKALKKMRKQRQAVREKARENRQHILAKLKAEPKQPVNGEYTPSRVRWDEPLSTAYALQLEHSSLEDDV
ncbi:hypothetical protein BC835DRAFT_1322135 [Cytidiella melzeri]|nr:hypothetical protein BC835DRAFT_1322135 [Cytidiella melzeri]